MSQFLKQHGYDRENAYFYQKDRELIEEARKKRIADGPLKLLPGGQSQQKPNKK